MGQRVAGTCYVKVDGAQLTITGGCEAPLMDVKRESVVPGCYKEEQLT
ncbi:phage tail tube protein, partial [Pseudomonas asiatica]